MRREISISNTSMKVLHSSDTNPDTLEINFLILALSTIMNGACFDHLVKLRKYSLTLILPCQRLINFWTLAFLSSNRQNQFKKAPFELFLSDWSHFITSFLDLLIISYFFHILELIGHKLNLLIWWHSHEGHSPISLNNELHWILINIGDMVVGEVHPYDVPYPICGCRCLGRKDNLLVCLVGHKLSHHDECDSKLRMRHSLFYGIRGSWSSFTSLGRALF